MPLSSLFSAALFFSIQRVRSHGVLTKPVSRILAMATNETENGLQFGGTCPNKACVWYSQDVGIPGPPTNCDKKMRTMGVNCGDTNPSDFTCEQKSPWCAPGSAPVRSPCGVFSGGWNSDGRDMLDLPGTPRETWLAGSVQEVAWAITANHGGGYAYRLCRADSDLSEACFQSTHLEFVGETQFIVNTTGVVVAQVPAFRTSNGTWPKNSQWTRNPFPMEQGLPGIPGLPDVHGRGPFLFNVMDRVRVPKGLSSGHYVLSWRWEAEQTKQVWAQCSDVMIVGGAGAARSSPKPRPPARHVCVGDSLGLSVHDCDAWVDLFDSLGGRDWPAEWAADCAYDIRLDPCGCNGNWPKYVQCSTKRDYRRITEIYLLSPNMIGQIPPSIGNFSALVALSFVGTGIFGSLPEEFGRLKQLEMLWLDHNPGLGGQLPRSFVNLKKLSAIELHHSNFSGAVPPLQWAKIPDCTLGDNPFSCPLPPQAETCGAACV